MKKYIVLSFLFISIFLFGCSDTSRNESALTVGTYFLDGYKNNVFFTGITYYMNTPQVPENIDENIYNICGENELFFADILDEHTVLIYGGAIFQKATGFIVTDGIEPPENLSDYSVQFGFDDNSLCIEKKYSDNLYSFWAGL